MKKNRLSPEVQKKVDEYVNSLLQEQIKMERLVSKNLDYIMLEELINKCHYDDVVIDIKLNTGETLHIHREKKVNNVSSSIGRTK